MNIKLTLLLYFSFVIGFSSFAQQESLVIPGEMVIQFKSEEAFIQFSKNGNPDLKFEKKVSDNLNVYLFKYNPSNVNVVKLSDELNNNPLIKAAGQNFQIQYRSTIPNDEHFDKQKSFDLIEAPEAWDINTESPEELVVAIIEGADINHEDLRDNIWTNPNEIPDDGIDNDNNGYIDDYYGVNVVDSTDNPIVDDHGVSVAGIIGANGNNEIGVAGMMWKTKMMIVSSNLTFIQIIQSYEYVYAMRKKYNDTDGAEGAFIVVTNSSFGVNNAYPNQQPIYSIWCDMYDMMGSAGVLSVAATNNNKVNIELVGDMPGLCQSDYLIVATATNLDDELEAAFSRNNVDLSAPGRSFTSDLNNSYNNFNGTSAAAPLVTGAIAMLYSYPCEAFQNQAREQPALTALQLKNTILESVDPLEELNDKTVSGGRLNVFNAMQSIQGQYGAPKGDLGFINIYPNPVHDMLSVEYQTSETSEYDLKVYDAVGRLVYFEQIPEICAKSVINIPVLNLASGTYFMSIENKNNIKSTRFTVY